MKQLADTSFDKIKAYILGKAPTLPARLENTHKRLQAAFTHLLDGGLTSDRDVARYLVATFNIHESQAYRDIQAAKLLYGDARRSTKEAERYIASENSKKQYNYAMDMFRSTKKISWYYAAMEQQKLHAKINVLDKDDPDLPDPSKINPPTQILQINIDFLTSQFANVIDEKGKKQLNKLLGQIENLVQKNRIGDYLDSTIDVPFIELKND